MQPTVYDQSHRSPDPPPSYLYLLPSRRASPSQGTIKPRIIPPGTYLPDIRYRRLDHHHQHPRATSTFVNSSLLLALSHRIMTETRLDKKKTDGIRTLNIPLQLPTDVQLRSQRMRRLGPNMNRYTHNESIVNKKKRQFLVDENDCEKNDKKKSQRESDSPVHATSVRPGAAAASLLPFWTSTNPSRLTAGVEHGDTWATGKSGATFDH